jgi:hypothetical protein
MTRNKYINPIEAYAPVPSWTVVKLQLALDAIHRLKFRSTLGQEKYNLTRRSIFAKQ